MTMQSQTFAKQVAEGKPTAETIAVQDNLIITEHLVGAKIYAGVVFEGGAKGIIWQMDENGCAVLPLTKHPVRPGEKVTIKAEELRLGVGKELLGRVINPLGHALDGRGHVDTTAHVPYFRSAPTFGERAELNEQLETGVTLVDMLLPVVKGQRIAIMGDSKSGKTSFQSQVAIHQAKQNRIVVYVLVAKRRQEMNRLIERFSNSGVMDNIILVVTTSSDPLPLGVMGPYAGCTIGEYFWHQSKDTVVIYDDFSAHAKLYREMSLMLGNNVGREAYPGDMFHVHSALLERAGKLKATGASQTVLVTGLTPGNDLTGYQSTSLISMTDGQIVFDTSLLQSGRQPAINNNLSVSRIGGRVQNGSQQELSRSLIKELSDYRSAKEYTRFNDQSSEIAEHEIALGEQIFEAFNQKPNEWFSLGEQRVLLDVIMKHPASYEINVEKLKALVKKNINLLSTKDEKSLQKATSILLKQKAGS
jgi:F-type H+-transporting ATPase subunit alpha